ncbi:MAG: helix-turn-helix transcriptional regulator [Deltaproteobacteria bacterium]|nr:helix-turn-helix transcriptional regulator [Nannocystaceae bacterium]
MSRRPPAAAPRRARAAELVPPVQDPALVLTRRVGERLHAIRRGRGYSLDELAELTGVSKGTLSQIETGGTNPTLGVLWRISDGLGLPFASLLGEGTRERATLVRRNEQMPIRSASGVLESRPLTPERALGNVEVYELRIDPKGVHESEAHAPGTREGVTVLAGSLRVRAGDAIYELATGDTLSFHADVPHAYENPGRAETRLYNVIVYSNG